MRVACFDVWCVWMKSAAQWERGYGHSLPLSQSARSYPAAICDTYYAATSLLFCALFHVEIIGIMSDTSDSDAGNESALMQSRKRRPETWKSVVKKVKRDKGKEYVCRKGSVVAGRTMGQPCACSKKCFDKVGRDNVKTIFEAYWALGSHDAQSNYILCSY